METTTKKSTEKAKATTKPTANKDKKVPIREKRVAFDSLSNSFKNNPFGIIGFFLTIIFFPSIFFDWSAFLGHAPYWFRAIAFWMSTVSLNKDPYGLPLIGFAITTVVLAVRLVTGFVAYQ